MEALIENFADNIASGGIVAPLLALAAGVAASFMPCSLSSIPLVIAYIGGSGEKSGKRAFGYSLCFAAGNAVTFVAMAVIAVFAGRMLGVYSRAWIIFLALLMFAMALQTWGLVNVIPSLTLFSKSSKRGAAGAFIAGILSGIFSSPCSTPMLIALLSIIAARENLTLGIVLMLFYALGYSCLAVIAGTSVGFVQKLNESRGYETASKVLKAVTGTVIMLIGAYMLYLAW